jgi:hypothetical protein
LTLVFFNIFLITFQSHHLTLNIFKIGLQIFFFIFKVISILCLLQKLIYLFSYLKKSTDPLLILLIFFFNGRISTLSFIVLQVIYVNVKLESLALFCKIFTRAVIIVIKSNMSVEFDASYWLSRVTLNRLLLFLKNNIVLKITRF